MELQDQYNDFGERECEINVDQLVKISVVGKWPVQSKGRRSTVFLLKVTQLFYQA